MSSRTADDAEIRGSAILSILRPIGTCLLFCYPVLLCNRSIFLAKDTERIQQFIDRDRSYKAQPAWKLLPPQP